MTNPGKRFEKDFKDSAKKQNIFFERIKDVFISSDLRGKVNVSPNKYDCIIYYDGVLVCAELKSTNKRSFSFNERIIKQHQIDNLKGAIKYKGVYAGFLFNFRDYDNQTYFVHINDFIQYKDIAQKGIQTNIYKSKIARASISLDICDEIGIKIENNIKRTRYSYNVAKLMNDIKEKYNEIKKT